ncbi:MAG: metal ABC transporter ATP-binding protein [Saccharofermentans sp.]|jgi:zinc transport system ATP-binding protein|nr:metal ABC transporter ATP-binding protein [Clostridiales bacterium]MCR5049213.1 metal ABC transporter ATP-binding protein [Saccharofermentans sp.]
MSEHAHKLKDSCHEHCHCIKINDLSVSFGDEKVLDDVSLHMHCGELTVIIGQNGAGKSTLLRAILGQIPHEGNIEFKETKTGNISNVMKIGYVPQTLNIERELPMTVYDLFASFISKYPVWLPKSRKLYAKIKEQLKLFSVEDCIDKQVGKLSGGQLQRVMLSIAVTPMPDLLILDEPVSGIDENGVRDFYRLVDEMKHKHDLAVLLVSHDLELVRKYADKVVLLDNTILCQGTPSEVFENDSFKKVFGGGVL